MKKLIAILNCHDDDVFCFRKEIIDHFIDHGYRVLISCPYGKRIEKIRRDNVIYEDILIDRRGKNPFKDYKLYTDYIKLFKKYCPSIVLSFTIKPNIYGGLAARKLKIPYISNITGLGSGFENGGITKKIILFLYKQVLNSASYVLFQNESNKDKILKSGILQHQRYDVIPGSGVNLDRFFYCDYPSEDKIVFNYIGRVMKDKNIDAFLFIAKRLHTKYKNTIFNIIGFIEKDEEHYRTELLKLEKDGIVRYCGPQEDVRPFIQLSHAIIHPSTYGEGLSNVCLESAAMGRAVLTTNVPGCGEIVEEGTNGFHFNPENRQEMIGIIEKFINLPYEKKISMGKVSRTLVEKKFSRNIVVNKYWALVNNII